MVDPMGISRLFIRFSLCVGLKKPPQVAPKTNNLKRSEEITDFKQYMWPGNKKAADNVHGEQEVVKEPKTRDKRAAKE